MIKVNGEQVKFKMFKGGEVSLDGEPNWKPELPKQEICAEVCNPAEQVKLFLLLDSTDLPIHLILPYMPYARADRYIDKEGFGLRMFIKILSISGVVSIATCDAHNHEACDRLTAAEGISFINVIPPLNIPRSSRVIFPDEGASRRGYEVCAVGHLIKQRDSETGHPVIKGIKLTENIDMNQDITLVDDICDGGRTFIEALQYLRGQGYVGQAHLRVVHGIFSHSAKKRLREAGFSSVEAYFDWTREGYLEVM